MVDLDRIHQRLELLAGYLRELRRLRDLPIAEYLPIWDRRRGRCGGSDRAVELVAPAWATGHRCPDGRVGQLSLRILRRKLMVSVGDSAWMHRLSITARYCTVSRFLSM